MGSREDDDYWNDKYDEEPTCAEHGDDDMRYDEVGSTGWYCGSCDDEDEINEVYLNG